MFSLKNLKIRTGHIISAKENPGCFISLMGVNGAGKSTLLFTIAGLVRPFGGHLQIDGFDILKISSLDRAKKISLLSTERSDTLSLSVREIVSLGRVPHTNLSGCLTGEDEKIIDRAIADFELQEFEHRNAAHLSDGERQRVSLARISAQQTDVILLDEPLSHLDIPWQARVMSLFRRRADEGKIVIASLHEFDHATKNADKIWLLYKEGGKFLQGTPDEMMSNLLHNFARI